MAKQTETRPKRINVGLLAPVHSNAIIAAPMDNGRDLQEFVNVAVEEKAQKVIKRFSHSRRSITPATPK